VAAAVVESRPDVAFCVRAASVTVAESMRAYYGDCALLRRLLEVPGREPQWDEVARRVLGATAPAAGS
jgi:hypothetical protein